MVAARAQQRLVGAAACPGCTPCPPAGRLAAAQGQPAARSQRERAYAGRAAAHRSSLRAAAARPMPRTRRMPRRPSQIEPELGESPGRRANLAGCYWVVPIADLWRHPMRRHQVAPPAGAASTYSKQYVLCERFAAPHGRKLPTPPPLEVYPPGNPRGRPASRPRPVPRPAPAAAVLGSPRHSVSRTAVLMPRLCSKKTSRSVASAA